MGKERGEKGYEEMKDGIDGEGTNFVNVTPQLFELQGGIFN